MTQQVTETAFGAWWRERGPEFVPGELERAMHAAWDAGLAHGIACVQQLGAHDQLQVLAQVRDGMLEVVANIEQRVQRAEELANM